MGRMGILVRGLGLALLLVLGCKTKPVDLRPPKQEEVLNVPPSTEARFSSPLQYPKDTPKAAQIKRGGAATPLMDPSRLQAGNRGSPGALY